MEEKNLLEVSHLKKYFPVKQFLSRTKNFVKAVDDVSFSIAKGEIFGLVGESGCGKSTTGRSILNLLPPTGGRVDFGGETICDVERKIHIAPERMRALRKEMQIIFQDPFASLDPRMSVGSIVCEGILKHKMMGKREAMERAQQLLERCGLEASNIKKYPHEFSGGQRQRIGIARSLALEPKFIVADEPVAALDVSIQSQVLALMLELKKDMDLTYLFISHDLGVVKYFCDRIGVMYLGSLVEIGESEEIFANMLHPYTRALFSAILKESPLDKRERIILKGEIPSPLNPPSGCKFHTRCSYCQEKCKKEAPQLRELAGGHWVACHFPLV